MDTREAIVNRHSVRHYQNIPINESVVEELKDEIELCNKISGLNIQLVTNDYEAFSGFMAHYGHFKGVSNYIALVGKDDRHLEEKVGYYGERVLIKAEELGLNTCWVALTYSKRRTHVAIGEDERLVCVIALGYGLEKGVPHRNKPVDKLAQVSLDDPEWYKRGINYAMMAPTAMNQQKFYIERSNNVVRISPGHGFYTKVDVGIVRYHFEIGAGKENFKWASEKDMREEVNFDVLKETYDEEKKNVVIISSSPRKGGNSDRLCEEFAKGAKDVGHDVEVIRVAEKNIGFCTGCFSCVKSGKCVLNDDMDEIIEKLLKADVLVLASPVYFFNMNAQLKVFIDRLIPCFDKINADIYLIATGHDENMDKLKAALDGIRGLTNDCLTGCKEKGRLVVGGLYAVGDIEGKQELKLAYQMGHNC